MDIPIDFAKLTRLSIESPLAFEAERSRLIGEYIRSLPEDRRKQAYLFQSQLDDRRLAMQPSEFLQYCVDHMKENLDKMQDMANEALVLMTETMSTASLPQNVLPFVKKS
jgi:hypothetical protein